MSRTTEPLFGREALILAATVTILLAALLAFAAAKNGSSYLFNSDAKYFYRVAIDPFGSGASFAGQPADVGVAYRYGRIFYPLLAWSIAAGRPGLVIWTMPVVYALSVGLLVACAASLLGGRGVRSIWAPAILLVPALVLTLPILFSEPLFVGLLLLVYVLDGSGRPIAAWTVAACLLLTREIGFVGLLPLLWRDMRAGSIRSSLGWVATLVPLAMWYSWVFARMGSWPVAGHAFGRNGTLAFPFMGFIEVIREGKPVHGWFLAAILLTVVSAAFASLVARRAHWFPITPTAALFTILLVCAGPASVRLPVQTIRLMLPVQMMSLLAVLGLKRANGTADDHIGSARGRVIPAILAPVAERGFDA